MASDILEIFFDNIETLARVMPSYMLMQIPVVKRVVITAIMLETLIFAPRAHAISILSGPDFTPATNAPLAGALQVTTDVNSRISILISDGTDIWEQNFYDYSTTHSVPLLGFKPDQTNEILVTVYDAERNVCVAAKVLTFVTAPLPASFPNSVVLKSEPSQMEPGYTLSIIQNRSYSASYAIIMDNSGEVVWYCKNPEYGALDVRQLANGNLFFVEPLPANDFLEMNMLGQTVNTLSPPRAYPVNVHEGYVTDHGTILYLSDVRTTVSNFPSIFPRNMINTNISPSLVTTQIDDNPVVEISITNGALLNVWDPLKMLDPTRVTWVSGDILPNSYGWDNVHANAIIEDTHDDSLIVSLRDQNAVYKFSRATGQLKWILSPPQGWGANWQPYLLTPVGTPFDWNWAQHAPMLTTEGTLILYNDGNYRAMPWDPELPDQDNYSSAEEFAINETNMTVSDVWNSAWQTNQDRLYTSVVGKAQWLPQTRDVLVTYGYILYVNGVHPSVSAPNAQMVRIEEYTHDPVPQVVFDISFWDYGNGSSTYSGYSSYRSTRIPDLYPHPAEPVTDLAITVQNLNTKPQIGGSYQTTVLEFSADPANNYLIQASSDLKNWTTIGTPVQAGGIGDYYFDDLKANQFTTRFYRVVTQ
ncbi:MAG TPA: aryl-sulfate sulfotransferase [Verrucomicrobiae bacterium]